MKDIVLMRSHPVLDFAAQELKKYLRMMMPESASPAIRTEPGAEDGFRLGLLEDFGLPDEAKDPALDDVIHVDCGPEGGVLAGSNPRSVLFSVYRFLRENGCRWLYPGVDGDYVPMKDVEKVFYHKMADMRFRGHCNEGSESQTCMLETIDFYAKQELNVYMMEFFVPFGYYDRFYSHDHNQTNRTPEPVSQEQVLQWKRQCECEIEKRGLQFHDMGHGWTADPFGLDTSHRDEYKSGAWKVPEEKKKYLALLNGKRELHKGDPLFTNLCYSNPEVRTTIAKSVAKYAETHQNVTYLHVWLGDMRCNHCECDNCRKLRPTDWYIKILNEIDGELQKKKLDTRVVFIAYVDTIFPPEKESIKNPERFSLLYAPISRRYTSSINQDSVIPPIKPYIRNAWEAPKTSEESFAYLTAWQEKWKGPTMTYEYHFWRCQYHDPGFTVLARRIYEDIRGLHERGVQGFIEDGSQRSFFPNGFPMYVYAETLMDTSKTFDEIKEDYFSHVYGKDWEKVYDLLEKISDAFDFSYMEGEKSADLSKGVLYNPEHAEALLMVPEYAARLRKIAQLHPVMPSRPETVSYRLLLRHAEYCDRLSRIFREKALGHDQTAQDEAKKFYDDFGKYEIELERYFDQGLAGRSIDSRLKVGSAAGVVITV